MKKTLFCFAVFLGLLANGQEFRVTTAYGYSIAELNDAKRIMLSTAIAAGIELGGCNDLYLTLAPAICKLAEAHTNASGANVFYSRYFLSLPLSLKKYLLLSRRSRWSLELGPYARSFFYRKDERRTASSVQVSLSRKLGTNWGMACNLGFRTAITESWHFELALLSQTDYLLGYKNREDRIRLQTCLLGFSLYKRMK